ncbi:hypothetical protein [Alicyclobacillus sp. SO9]|uniref:hypothetical protein n=1 Tax=Alicyclobacillus sp. SO9 TaxID=2665646 RepID=UPI0018E7A1D1|nr:hypothetical protein [Alicyclobacillus sp. SO9]QQE80623.1 hypothetical protein GI364_09605 [Alicyclobacillus sp. SO9]
MDSPLGVEHKILPETLDTKHLLYSAVERYNLEYKVWKDNESHGFVEFVVQSNEFPEVQGSSWNNPNVM